MEKKLKLVHIPPETWLPGTYARALKLSDILRNASDAYETLESKEKDSLRQSQIETDEVVRVLGHHERYALIMKSDKVLGWVRSDEIVTDPTLTTFAPAPSLNLSVDDFFASWKGTRYMWGGITHAGIDCSGLTQRFLKDVLNRVIPKNTFDQRRSGTSKSLEDIGNNDLIFCTRIGGRGTHHVGIYVDGNIWHAHRERGVICQSLQEFLSEYQVLELISLG
jgi:hypothetical protein